TDLAIELNQNVGRCIDGFNDGLIDTEERFFGSGKPKHAGDFISRVFAEYRMEFIKKHAELNPASSEYQTTAPQVLRQRMLYSLGLRGHEAEIAHPMLGSPKDPALKPGAVMLRFLKGGKAKLSNDHAPTVNFEAFDVFKMVQLLDESR